MCNSYACIIMVYSEPLPIEYSTVVNSRVLLYTIVNGGRDICLFFTTNDKRRTIWI